MSQKKASNINQQVEKLTEIVAWFERDDIDIEEAIKKFEEGSKLAEEVKEQLDGLENKITVLKQRFDEQA